MKTQQKEQDHVSVLSWMVVRFLMVIPVVGALVVILGAFFGKNRTQRNFFRAIVMWHLIVYAFLALFIALGLFDAFWPTFFQYAQTLLEKLRLFINPS